MTKTLALLIAAALAVLPTLALADDSTPSGYTPAEQAKAKKEADAKKAKLAKMTPEERAAAKKAEDEKRAKDEATIEKNTQNPGDARNMGINKAAAASAAGPNAKRGYINTPEAEQKMYQQKGQ